MSISFSGLASGLDTSSWIQQLVALKQAKVTTLQTQRENVLLSKNTLNSIKNFFNSFRSTIERITDTRFNIVSMDLFAQNIATSANLNIATATATAEAKEGKYEVKVDKLATNTKVESSYKTTTTVVETTAATNNSKLKELGVGNGEILITVDGLEYGVSITEDDTLATFVQKLKDIGVDANFNERTGIFSINSNIEDINDIGNTGIVEALHLQDVTEGYQTNNKLQIEETEEAWEAADEDTKLVDLGVKAGTFKIRTDGFEYNIAVDENTSIGNLIDLLDTKAGITATLTADGVFTINDAEITDEGTTNIIDALGLVNTVSKGTQNTDILTFQTVTPETTTVTATATLDTKLKDLGVTDFTITQKKYSGDGTSTTDWEQSWNGNTAFMEEGTISDFISYINSRNSSDPNKPVASFDEETGVITITSTDSSYVIEGGIADALGIGVENNLGTETVGNSATSTTPVTYVATLGETMTSSTPVTAVVNSTVTGTAAITYTQAVGETLVSTSAVSSTTGTPVVSTAQITYTETVGETMTSTVAINSTVGTPIVSTAAITYTQTVTVGNTVTSTAAIKYTVGLTDTLGSYINFGERTRITEGARIDTSTGEIIGSGNTVIITSENELLAMQGHTYTGKDFYLTNDIDFAGLDFSSGGIVLIGCSFNGQGYSIQTRNSAARYSDSSGGATVFDGIAGYGLISYAEDTVFKDITYLGNVTAPVALLDVPGDAAFGGLVGVADGCVFNNINSSLYFGTNNNTGVYYVGNIAGYAIDSHFHNISVDGSIRTSTATENYVGGVVGRSYNSEYNGIMSSYSSLEATAGVGGVIGYNISSDDVVENCYVKTNAGSDSWYQPDSGVNMGLVSVYGLAHKENIYSDTEGSVDSQGDNDYIYNPVFMPIQRSSYSDIYEGEFETNTICLYKEDGGYVCGLITIDANTTLQDLVTQVNNIGSSQGISMSITNGNVAIEGGYITDQALCEFFNISAVSLNIGVQTGSTVRNFDKNTKLEKLGVSGNVYLTIKDSETGTVRATYTITPDMSLRDINNLADVNKWIKFSVNYGRVTITPQDTRGYLDNSSLGTLASKFKISDPTCSESTVTKTATMDTTLTNIQGIDQYFTQGHVVSTPIFNIIDINGNIATTIRVGATDTFQTLNNQFGAYGSLSIENGIMTISMNDGYLLKTVGSSYIDTDLHISRNKTYSTSSTITEDSTLMSIIGPQGWGNFQDGTFDLVIRDANGNEINTFSSSNPSTTVGDIISFIEDNNYGTCTLENGVLSITTNEGYFIDSEDLESAFGMSTTTNTVTHTADENTTMSKIAGGDSYFYSGRNIIEIKDVSGTRLNFFTVEANDTISSLNEKMNGYGSVSINDGVMNINTDNGYYVNMRRWYVQSASSLGLAAEVCDGGGYEYKTTTTINYNSTLGSILTTSQLASLNKTVTITSTETGAIIATQTFDADSTIADITEAFNGYISLGIDNGIVTIQTTNGYSIDGELLDTAFGLQATTNNTTHTANMYTKMSDLNIGNFNMLTVSDHAGNVIFTLNVDSTDTFETLNTKLSPYGSLSVNDGVISIEMKNAYHATLAYASGNIMLGLNVFTNYFTSSTVQETNTLDQILTPTELSSLNMTVTVTNTKTGETIKQTFTKDSTISEIKDFLDEYATISITNGSTTITTNENYIIDSNLVDAVFNFTSPSTTTETRTVDWDTTLYELGMTSSTTAIRLNTGVVTFNKNSTISDIADALSDKATVSIDQGKVTIDMLDNHSIVSISTDLKNLLKFSTTQPGTTVITTGTIYNTPSSQLQTKTETTTTTITTEAVTEGTKLADLGVTSGEFIVFSNGVKYTATIDLDGVDPDNPNDDATVGSLLGTLRGFGLTAEVVNSAGGSYISVEGTGESYLLTSPEPGASNVVSKLFNAPTIKYDYTGTLKTSDTKTTYVDATVDNLLSEFNNGYLVAEGDFCVKVNGEDYTIKIGANETIGSFVNKLNFVGANAHFIDGQLTILGDKNNFSINQALTTSSVEAMLGLTYTTTLDGFSASDEALIQSKLESVEKDFSVSNYAGMGTKLSTMGITGGSLSILRDGQTNILQVDSNKTFAELQADLSGLFGGDVEITINDGIMSIASKTEDIDIKVGTTSDTSNIVSIAGLMNNPDGTVKSTRELYCVNSNSLITETGLFRAGDVREGTFVIGDAIFTINDNTTISSLVSQINATESAKATAYWDNTNAKLIIESRLPGSSLVNFAAGTSNFTDIMGFTTSEYADTDGDGVEEATLTKININTQTLGENAKFSINGTEYTATTNTIDSSISRIEGLTIELKGISETGTTITVERNKDGLADAVEEVVNSYNELITNIDQQLASGSALQDESGLKFLRNQIRSLMTGTFINSGSYKNLHSIGITLEAASSGNISTANLDKLSFNREKFIQEYSKDPESMKMLLVGNESQDGLLSRIEDIVTRATEGGYFSSAEKSYSNKISRLDSKIKRQEIFIDSYKKRLEAKFNAMDLLISKMQNQYSSFLSA